MKTKFKKDDLVGWWTGEKYLFYGAIAGYRYIKRDRMSGSEPTEEIEYELDIQPGDREWRFAQWADEDNLRLVCRAENREDRDE